MDDGLLQQFIQLISANTGLYIRQQEREALCKKIRARMKLLKLTTPENYYQLLNTADYQSNSPLVHLGERENEWRELTRLLTIGETYFFRDQGQLTLLKTRILPELIEHKKKVWNAKVEAKPSLRLWSAGCSTGEEPYSLAILVKELIPDYAKWDILILGTDINSEVIEQAKQGLYDSWSLRITDPTWQGKYFHQCQTKWQVNEQIRSMVTLRPGNLIKDYFPSYTSGIHDMDIIICRNVFIYFDSNSIAVVLEKFCNTLRLGGYLVAGHTELQGQSLGQLQTKVFAESVVYQRGEGLRVETPLAISQALPVSDSLSSSRMLHENIAIKESSTTNSSNLVKTTSETVLSQAEIFFYKSDYTKVIEEAEQVIKQHPQHFAAYSLIAQALANLGESEKAISYCQQALKIDSLSVTPYYLLAHIAEEQGDIEKAKEIFKKIIYLAPSSIPAYLELGSIYEKEGDATKARKVRSTALELLKELPADSFVQPNSEITVGELFLQVKNLLRNNT